MYQKLIVIFLTSSSFGTWLVDAHFVTGQIQPPPVGNTLVVVTDPPGAEVLVDGNVRGTTVPEQGLVVNDLSVGMHTLVVHKKWYRPMERTFKSESGKRNMMRLALGQPVGFISVRSSLPHSRIEIKGVNTRFEVKEVEVAELNRVEVPAGKYQVQVTPPNTKPQSQVIDVTEGVETELVIDFGPDAISPKMAIKSTPIEVINRGRADRPLLKAGEHYGAFVGGYLAPEVIPLPSGSFQMGSETAGEDEKPIHTVYVEGFDMGRTLVTNAQYKTYCDATKQEYPQDPAEWGSYFKDYADHPVLNVSWEDGSAYCAWLSKVTGLKYRLPTEAQWEYAARGGLTGKLYPWGDEDPKGRACYMEGNQIPFGVPTMRVGTYAPNGYGLYDTVGNVWQLCWDWYDVSYYRSGNNRNPKGAPEGTNRVARGGAWLYPAYSIRCAIRLQASPYMQHETIGFRVALVRE